MKKKVLALVLTLAMVASLLTVPAAATGSKTYPDAVGHWAEESILRWSRCGLVKGDNLGNVNPDKPLRRCEMATILADMLGLRKAAPISTFKDINGSEWYARAILRCAAAGIMEGSNSMSYPEDYITREEAIVMFGRALGVQPNDDPDLSDFLDGEEVSGWAAPYMATLTELGILSGMGDGTVAPHADINRAGAFTLMDKAISVYANAPGTYTSQNANGFVVINANSQQEGEVILTGKATGVLVAVGATNPVRLRDLKAENVLVEGKGDVVVSGKSSLDALAANTEIAVTVDTEASVGTLDVNVEKIAVTNAGEIKKLNCGEAGSVTNSGKVAELVADAPSAITNTGTVDKLVANAAITVNNTKGTVKNAEINMGGVVMDGPPQQMTVASGVVRPANSSGRPITATGAVSSGGGGGGGGSSTPSKPTPGIKLDKTTAELTEGKTMTLKATVTLPSSDAIKGDVIWTSSDDTVATVEDGTVTAVKEGEATITAKVTVTIPEPSPSPSPSASPSPSPSTEPSPSEEPTPSPSPSEEATPSPSPSETATPSPSPSEEATPSPSPSEEVTPSPSPSEEATPSPSPSEEATPSPSPSETVTPDPEPGESSDPNPSEPVEGGSEGDGDTETELPPPAPAAVRAAAPAALSAQAAPAARADNTKTYTATCKVTVKAKPVETVAVTGVTLDKSELTLEAGRTVTLTATVAPADATDKSVTWASSNESVATVSANGKVTAVAEGAATITVKTADGGFTKTCTVTVTPGTTQPLPVTAVTLDKEKLALEVGGEATLVATVTPDNADDKTVTWTSSDSNIASVDENGKVTAVAAGTATITATAGNQTATCEVTVTEKTSVTVTVTGVELDQTTLTAKEGDTLDKLVATVKPEDATNKKVTWQSSDASVVTVDAEGNVTIVGKGSATITVTTEDGSHTATCTITVTAASEGGEDPEPGTDPENPGGITDPDEGGGQGGTTEPGGDDTDQTPTE